MTDENTSFGSLSMESGVEALLGTPSEPKEPKKKRPTESDEVTESEETVNTEEAAVREKQRPTVEVEEEPEVDDPDEDEPSEEESDDEESEATDDEESDEDDSENPILFTLEDGTEVTSDEAKRGYLRQADYTKKTQALAEQAKQVQQAYQSREQERQTLAENLNLALSVVEPQLADLARTDWSRLAQTDPYEYTEKRALFEQAQERYNALSSQAQQIVTQQQQESQAKRQRAIAQESEKLKMAMPDFADPNKARKLKGEITEYAMSLGLSEGEAKSISDHRLILVLEKARKFDEMSNGSLTAAKKKLSKTPKRALKSGNPKTKGQRQETARNQQMQKLRSTGKLDDAVALIMNQ